MFQPQQAQAQQTYYYLARPLAFDVNTILQYFLMFALIMMMMKYLAPERA